MKKVLLTLLGIIVVVGALAGAGFAGYRIGFRQGAAANTKIVSQVPLPEKGFDPRNLPMPNFGRNFERGFRQDFGPRGLGMMERGPGGRGFGFFGPLFFLARLAFWVLIIWLGFLVLRNSGWTLTRQATAAPKADATPAPEEKSPETHE